MTIIQGLIASINNPVQGGGGGGNFTPTDTGITLGTDWTIEIVAELTPTTFWATLWGNEIYNSGLGHFAYLTSTTNLNVGSPIGTDGYDLSSISIANKAHWAFSHQNGSGISVYHNGVLLNTNSPGYVQANPASNTLLIGARHNNGGDGSTDFCTGTYYYNHVTSSALDAAAVQASYDGLKLTYGLP